MKYKTTWVTKGVIITFCGVVENEDIFQVVEEINSDPRFDDIRYQIRDYTEVTEFNVDVKCVPKIAAWDKAAAMSNPNMKIAIVTTDSLMQILSSLYLAEIFMSHWEGKIFNTMDEAQQWVS